MHQTRSLPSLPLVLTLAAAGCGTTTETLCVGVTPDAATATEPDAHAALGAHETPPEDAGSDAFAPDAPRVPIAAVGGVLPQRLACPPALAFRADGTPLLATFHERLRVHELDGDTWTQVGPDVSTAAETVTGDACPDLVVNGSGVPYVAYESMGSISDYHARIRHFDGTAWIEDLDIDRGAGLGHAILDLDMDVDASGDPIVGFVEVNTDGTFGYGIAVRRFDGGAFTRSPITSGLTVNELRIAVRPDDSVVAAYQRTIPPFGSGVGLVELRGGSWGAHADVDTIGDTTQSLVMTGVDADATRSWVSWIHGAGTVATRLSEREGSTYRSIEPADAANGRYPVVTHLGGDELVWAYTLDQQLQARHFDGTTYSAPITTGDLTSVIGTALDHDQIYVTMATTFGGGPADARLYAINF